MNNFVKLIASYLVKPKMKLLEQNIDKIDWSYLSYNENPKALQLLEQNIDKIDWDYLSLNPNIFEIDKIKLKQDINEQTQKIDN